MNAKSPDRSLRSLSPARGTSALIRTVTSLMLACLAVATMGGCAGFDRDFRAALSEGVPAEGISGPWTGIWRSETSDHDGTLRAIITSQPDGTYEARFHATYGQLLSYEQVINLRSKRSGDRWLLEGEEDVGTIWGGTYIYRGSATPDRFEATYTADNGDSGVFEMDRPVVESGAD